MNLQSVFTCVLLIIISTSGLIAQSSEAPNKLSEKELSGEENDKVQSAWKENHSEEDASALENYKSQDDLMVDSEEIINALYKNDGLYREFDYKSEVKSKRSEYAKHFRQQDGTLTAILGSGPLHYYEDGVWKTMLSHILPNTTSNYTDYKYAAFNNKHKIYFPANPGQPNITTLKNTIYKDWGQPTMVWLDKDKNVIGKVKYNPSTVSNASNDSLVYKNVFNDVDAHILNSTDTKELTYYINSPSVMNNKPQGAVYLAFRENINFTGDWELEGTASEEKVFASVPSNLYQNFKFVNPKGDTLVKILNPQYYDNSPYKKISTIVNSDSIRVYKGSYLINEKSKSSFEVYTLVPITWLEFPTRVYPIVIDPITYYYPVGTYATYTIENSGYCGPGTWGGRAYTHDITYGWSDDDIFGSGNEYWSAYATYNITALADNSCLFGVTYYWYRYGGRTCDDQITLKFGRGQTNHNLQLENSCGVIYSQVANNTQYYRGTGLNGSGWRSRTGSVSHLSSALAGNHINMCWDYDGGDDCCTFLCSGNDGDYHNVYGYQHSTAKTYARVDYEGGPPSGFDRVWTGRVSTSWTSSSNWCPTGVPTSLHRVLIPNTTRKPTISTTVDVSCITIYSSAGALLNITSTGTLNVFDNSTCRSYP